MKKSWKENIISKYRQAIRKNRFLKLPLSVALLFVVFFYNIGAYFYYNKKKFSSMVAILLFAIISSSFAFPGMLEEENTAMENESEWAEIQENYDYVPVELGISKDEVLDDEDVIIGYDNEELDVQD